MKKEFREQEHVNAHLPSVVPSVDELQHPLEGLRLDINNVHLAGLGFLHVLVKHAIKDRRPGQQVLTVS